MLQRSHMPCIQEAPRLSSSYISTTGSPDIPACTSLKYHDHALRSIKTPHILRYLTVRIARMLSRMMKARRLHSKMQHWLLPGLRWISSSVAIRLRPLTFDCPFVGESRLVNLALKSLWEGFISPQLLKPLESLASRSGETQGRSSVSPAVHLSGRHFGPFTDSQTKRECRQEPNKSTENKDVRPLH